MAQSIASRLLKLKPAPIATPAILKALSGDALDPDALVRDLTAQAETVIRAREALADVPPVITATGSVLL